MNANRGNDPLITSVLKLYSAELNGKRLHRDMVAAVHGIDRARLDNILVANRGRFVPRRMGPGYLLTTPTEEAKLIRQHAQTIGQQLEEIETSLFTLYRRKR